MHLNPKEVIEKGYLEPSEYTVVQQVGVDLTIESDIDLREAFYQVVRLNERFKLPEDVFAVLFPRSTLIRMGVIVQCGVIEPGYVGRPVVAVHSFGRFAYPKGSRIVQAVFFKGNPASVYGGRYQYEGL